MTHRELIARYLTHYGCVLINKTDRRWTYSRPAGGYYYLGRSGSWRFGRNYSTSCAVTGQRKDTALSFSPHVPSMVEFLD